MKSQMGGLRRKFLGNHLITAKAKENAMKDVQKEENAIEWLTLFQLRRNWHIYVDLVLGIKLRPFQMIMIYLMGISDVFFAICCRGLSKTFIVGLGNIVKMNLYPYTEAVITSSTVAQANKMVEDKIRDELIKKLSPYLLYMYEHEYLVITKPEDGYRIENKLNGSTLRVLPCQDSSRGPRATILTYEETRLLKKGMVDSVFEKMAHPRQAKYLSNPVYGNNPRWKEECQHIYITSARYKFEWFWLLFKKTFTRIFTDTKVRCNIFAGDIFMAIDNGFKTWADYWNGKAGGEMDFRMEDLNEMISEGDDAFFNLKSFKENQIIDRCFRPPTALQFFAGEQPDFPEKKEDEIRLVIMDIAFANTTGCTKNDNTIITLMSAHWDGKKNRFERHIDYIEGHDASDTIGASDRFRYLKWVYDADYAAFDGRSGGEVIYNHLTEPLPMPNLGARWNGCGLSPAEKYHVVSDAKLADYHSRVVDKNAVPCLIPVIATPEINSQGWLSLRKQLETNNMKFLISMQDYQNELTDSGEYYQYTAEELVNQLEPYGQTDMMVIEAVNLKTVIKQDKIKLEEPRTGTKDRIVTIMYGNYIIDLIENAWQQQLQEDEFDIESIQLVY